MGTDASAGAANAAREIAVLSATTQCSSGERGEEAGKLILTPEILERLLAPLETRCRVYQET
jgi:hypothetical protein